MADQTTPIADAAKALLDAWAAFKELAGDEERDAMCSVCGRHPCGQLDHGDDCPMLLLPAALAGGSPAPTPGPTRERVSEAVMAALMGHDPDSPEAFDAITDAVTALLSTPATTVLWEGETVDSVVPLGGRSILPSDMRILRCPPGTHVVVTREAVSG